MTAPITITSEIQKLAPSAIVEVYEIDASDLGAGIFRFHSGTNGLNENLIWQGNVYTKFPVEVTGFEVNGQGQVPRPKMKISNYLGSITTLLLAYKDLIGAKVTRKRTLVKYLDVGNFPGGLNPTADSTASFPDDVFFIDRKANENRNVIEFELASVMDLSGVQVPRRQIVQNLCTWAYRSAECGYTGTNYFTANDVATTVSGQDKCGKRLSSCRLRFGQTAVLPFGGFPGVGLYRG